MDYNEYEIYNDGLEQDILVKNITLGFTKEGKKIRASFRLTVPNEYEGDPYEDPYERVHLIARTYFKYFVFEHAVKILKMVKLHTKFLESIGYLNLDEKIVDLQHARDLYLKKYDDLLKEPSEFKVEVQFYKDHAVLDNLEVLDNLHLVESFEFKFIDLDTPVDHLNDPDVYTLRDYLFIEPEFYKMSEVKITTYNHEEFTYFSTLIEPGFSKELNALFHKEGSISSAFFKFFESLGRT